jgi:putative addiction module antidote
VPAVKVTTIGNSLGIVLPRDVLQRLRIEKGSLLYMIETHEGVELVPYEPSFAAQVEALERTARSDRDVLRALALHRASPAGASVRRVGPNLVEEGGDGRQAGRADPGDRGADRQGQALRRPESGARGPAADFEDVDV